MKRILFALVALTASIALTSCRKADDADAIVGTWVCNDPVHYADGSTRDYTETYVFKTDGTMSLQFICEDLWDDHWTFGSRLDGTYTADGTKFTFTAHIAAMYEKNDGKAAWQNVEGGAEERSGSFEYKIEGKKMTVYYGQECAVFGHGGSAVMVFNKK